MLKVEGDYVAEIVMKALDPRLTPANIEAGFKATWIFEFNPEIFNDDDFIAAGLSGEIQSALELEGEDDQRQFLAIFGEGDEPAAHEHEEVTTSASELASTSASLLSLDPLRLVRPRTKSKRGRKRCEVPS